MPLYADVASKIGLLIDQGTYRPGDRLPSIRQLSRQLQVSLNTVMAAYAQLENLRAIEARPQSGYYVSSRFPEPPRRIAASAKPAPRTVSLGAQPLEILHTLTDPALGPLGHARPNPAFLPIERLNRMLAAQSRRFPLDSVCYPPVAGVRRLRTLIAQRLVAAGCALAPEDLVITSGCVEAVSLALEATCRPGDTVAAGSPVYSTFLNAMQWLGLKVLEIPSCPVQGMSLDVLSYVLQRTRVAACLNILNFNNPLGSRMPDANKRELVRLLARHGVPLIEDDIYGELAFSGARPSAAKAFDRDGLVLLCSSFSKTLAPGYRVGWIVPGRYQSRVESLKSLFNVATAAPTQLALAEFLANGGYDRHLRALRKIYARQVAQIRDAVGRHFPEGTSVTRPEGGAIVWVEMPEPVDALRLYQAALREGIAIAPGPIFTTGGQFRNCIRLNSAFWSERVEQSVATLGALARALASARPPNRRRHAAAGPGR